jgi:hypothetical protein
MNGVSGVGFIAGNLLLVTNARPPPVNIPTSITPKVMGLPNANVYLYVQNITSPSAKCPITLGHIHLEQYLHRSVFSRCTKDMLLRVSRIWKYFSRLLEWNFVVHEEQADSF